MTPKPAVVVFARNVVRMARFYGDVAAMSAVQTASDHVVLELESFQVVIHGVPKKVAASITIATPPVVRQHNPVKLCLPVGSIGVARRIASERGGRVQPKSREWEARGFRACDGHDPEGNVFQVREDASPVSASGQPRPR